MARFSKKQLYDHAVHQISKACEQHKFHEGDGWSSVVPKNLPSTKEELMDVIERAVEFGRMAQMRDLIQQYNLGD